MRYILPLLLWMMLCPQSAEAQRHAIRRGNSVLAHSLNFDPERATDDMPVALQEMLRAYRTQPRYAERQKGRAVAPLLRSVRDQSEPYNRSCPFYTDKDGQVSETRCKTGCVAVCIEQVLNYYHYPNLLADTLHGWETDNYTIPDVLPGTKIDWPNILNDYRLGYSDEQAQAVSDLSLWCGMAVHMNWGVLSSGADLERAVEPLWRVFGYKTVNFVSRAMYSTPKWNAMLRHELENGRPICYTGHNMALSGHAFNIDGVDEEGYYHLNWGYGGDYDGYFDLDYLNPFESQDDVTPLGQNEGFFSNQTALFMHPEEIDIDVTDSLTKENAFAGVRVDNISFRRQPDTQEYVVGDFTMTNTTQDSLNFTFEMLTFLPTDTAIFYQADYVGLSAVNLAPGETRTWPVYCRFKEAGERIFSFSPDDETLPYQMNIFVERGTTPVLEYGEVDYKLIAYGDNLVADLSLDVTNRAKSGYAGSLITFCLFPDGSDEDMRHWEILSLPGGETHRISSRFQHLEDGKTYTLRVRQPWPVKQEYTFTVRKEEATDAIQDIPSEVSHDDDAIYDLIGRRMPSLLLPKGIYIRNGKKIVLP